MAVRKNLAILGSTGSIGRNALEVVPAIDGLEVWGLSGCQRLDLLVEQARQYPQAQVVAADSSRAAAFAPPASLNERWSVGADRLVWMAAHPDVDVVLAAIVGCAGLPSTHAAVAAGKTVALANKESLVVAGHLLMPLAAERRSKIVPVDSEHSAVWQASLAGRKEEIKRVVLTASGGPFRDLSPEQLAQVTPRDALAHPTWNMGPKITIDSATLLNKALEIIEARWLFDLQPDQIEVVIHPQSIVHSLVEFRDGSVLAQLGPPDMRLPIQYALSHPQRVAGPARRMDWTVRNQLDLIPPNEVQRSALELGFEVIRRGGSAGAVLNAANEAAVAAFLAGNLGFAEIVPACREVLEQHQVLANPTLDQLLAADRWAREEIEAWIGCL
ncbi:MAG: 1-deoxy-D-xylulose-5-phosphate reductoisomerase [Planctomycetota bacterium]|jgi:1-deoxy-D-xylulose-5-phosphate reductoisomerase